eukprot:scaffold246654_cov32-Tisochrysis_lutea.AAC.1
MEMVGDKLMKINAGSFTLGIKHPLSLQISSPDKWENCERSPIFVRRSEVCHSFANQSVQRGANLCVALRLHELLQPLRLCPLNLFRHRLHLDGLFLCVVLVLCLAPLRFSVLALFLILVLIALGRVLFFLVVSKICETESRGQLAFGRWIMASRSKPGPPSWNLSILSMVGSAARTVSLFGSSVNTA